MAAAGFGFWYYLEGLGGGCKRHLSEPLTSANGKFQAYIDEWACRSEKFRNRGQVMLVDGKLDPSSNANLSAALEYREVGDVDIEWEGDELVGTLPKDLKVEEMQIAAHMPKVRVVRD